MRLNDDDGLLAFSDMSPTGLGVVLGALNVLFIAVGMALTEGLHPGAVLLVMVVGMMPGVALGAVLGWLAGLMKSLPVWPRRILLLAPALLMVDVLGREFELQHLIAVSCIPTAVCVLILERHTRFVPPQYVPPAQVHRA